MVYIYTSGNRCNVPVMCKAGLSVSVGFQITMSQLYKIVQECLLHHQPLSTLEEDRRSFTDMTMAVAVPCKLNGWSGRHGTYTDQNTPKGCLASRCGTVRQVVSFDFDFCELILFRSVLRCLDVGR
jgi:hypothetical protein